MIEALVLFIILCLAGWVVVVLDNSDFRDDE